MINSGVVRLRGMASLVSSSESTSNDGNRSGGVIVRVSSGAEGLSNNNTTTQQSQQQTTTYRAKHILLATGGYPTMPSSDSSNDRSIARHAITSDGFFELKSLPRKAAVVGAGYIAIELAGVLQALGSETSLVVRKEKALRNFYDLLSETLDDEIERHGIHIYRNTEGVDRIVVADEEGEGGGSGSGNTNATKKVILNNGEVIEDVDVVIMAAGRSPMVESLGLEEVGVQQKL